MYLKLRSHFIGGYSVLRVTRIIPVKNIHLFGVPKSEYFKKKEAFFETRIADCEVMLSSRWHQSDQLGILQQQRNKNQGIAFTRLLPDHRRYCPPRPISDSATHLRYNIRRHSWSRISIDVIANACRMCIHHRLQITDVAVFFRSWMEAKKLGWNDGFPDDLNNNRIRRGKAQERRVGGMFIGILLFCISQTVYRLRVE
jgi:hypothetical protein